MHDPKAFWKTIKKIMPGESKEVSSSFEINGEICTDNKQIAASFNSFFTETVSRLVQLIGAEASLLFRSPKKTVTTDKTSQTFIFAEISEEFVHKKLKSICCENILSAPSMTPDEKSTLYSNEYHRFQAFKNQLQSKFQSLEDQLTGVIKKATKSIEEAKNKPQSSQLHADVEYSDEDDIVQVDAEDSDPDVAA